MKERGRYSIYEQLFSKIINILKSNNVNTS